MVNSVACAVPLLLQEANCAKCVTYMKEFIDHTPRHAFFSFTLRGIHKGNPRIRYGLNLDTDRIFLVV